MKKLEWQILILLENFSTVFLLIASRMPESGGYIYMQFKLKNSIEAVKTTKFTCTFTVYGTCKFDIGPIWYEWNTI